MGYRGERKWRGGRGRSKGENGGERKNIRGLISVKHPRIQHPVQLQRDVVRRDGALTRYLNGILLQTLHIGDAVQERDQDSQSGLQDPTELPHSLDDPGGLLGDEADDSVCGEGGGAEVGGGAALGGEGGEGGRELAEGGLWSGCCVEVAGVVVGGGGDG